MSHPVGQARRGPRWIAAVAAGALVWSSLAAGVAGAAGAAPVSKPARTGVAVLSPSAATTRTLERSFAKARGRTGSLRSGSVHVADIASSGVEWAVATFRPAAASSAAARVAFQDGGGTGIFSRQPGQGWKFVGPGAEPLACDTALPAAVRRAWDLGGSSVSCSGGSAVPPAARAEARAATGSSGIGTAIADEALSQVGVSDIPDVTNFNTVDCDPYTTMVGPWYPNPDVRGCGYNSKFRVQDENEEWCADFAEWVWQQAGVTQDMDLINPGANSFYAWGQAQGQPLTVDGTDPAVGDAVVFYEPGPITTSTGADHVGIVTAVNPDGTVNLVNGDFLGSTNISVQYNTDVDLSTWSAAVWGPGEQWVFVTPPSGTQPAAPHVTLSGPRLAAADTDTTWRAAAVEPGGSISSYVWAFGDGEYVPGGTETGAVAQHVFADPGRSTVTLIAVSNLGTLTVKTWNIDVLTPASTVTSTASDALYYAYTPVDQRMFVAGATGGLTEESWDGASWLDEALPGDVAANSPVAALDYKNPDDSLAPHAFARSSNGGLLLVDEDNGAWTATTLPGAPAAGSPIAAINLAPPGGANETSPPYPAVFYVTSSGQVGETSGAGGKWTTSVLRVAAGRVSQLAVGTVAGPGGQPEVVLYTHAAHGPLVATVLGSPRPLSEVIPDRAGLAPGSTLSAVSSAGAGQPALYFVDRNGLVAAATPTWRGWSTSEVSTVPVSATGSLQAFNDVPASGAPVPEVFAASPSGSVLLATLGSSGWSTQTLGGDADTLLGLAAYPVPGASQALLFRGPGGVQADTTAGGTGPWSLSSLPSTPVTFDGRIVLYGADSADYGSALTAAEQAGLPSSQVTGSFATAWADALSGDYLVIAVGLPATDGLYFNVCGWDNPSDAFAGSTPFYYVNPPIDQLPGADAFEEAAGSTSAQTAALAHDLAYYAVNGQLPSGVSSLPAEAGPEFSCAGTPTAS